MAKKTSGIDDLIKTMVKQHGLEKAIDIARSQARELKDERRAAIWSYTLPRLKDMR